MNSANEMEKETRSRIMIVARVSVIALPALMLLGAIIALAVNVPYWDDYDAIVRYFGWPFAERMQHLFDFHNEHRIVTVRLFLEAMIAVTGKVNFKTCMILGSVQLVVIFAFFVYFYLKQFGRRLGFMILAIASWHLFSMLNFDNAFWALTALENFGVLMWAFLAIILYCRAPSRHMLFLAWICAFLSILTSAQGLAVLMVFLLMSVAPSVECHSWRTMIGHVKQRVPYRVLGVLACMAGTFVLYFRGFVPGSENAAVASASCLDRLLYVIAFAGNLVPIYPVALICGCLVLAGVVYVTWHFPCLPARMRPVFFFMLYCVGVAAAGVFFRASDPHAALSFRYYIITACLFVSVVGLLLSLEGKVSCLLRTCGPLLLAGFFALDVFVFVIGWPMFAERNEALRKNLLTWPEHLEGLRVDEKKYEASAWALQRLEEKGIYDHFKLLRDGEKRPQDPVPWPKPHFP